MTSRPKTLAQKRRIETREAILEAARQIVGAEGFSAVSMARISVEVGISVGSIYSHFPSHGDLLEEILPSIEPDYYADRKEIAASATSYLDFESRDIEAILDFAKRRPEFKNIILQAPMYAPNSFERHLDHAKDRFLVQLRRAWDRGEISTYPKDDLEIIAEMILWNRVNSFRMYFTEDEPKWDPDKVTKIYLRLIGGGLGVQA